MSKLYHIGFHFPGVPKMRDLEPMMSNIATDWVRYAFNCWIIKTEIAPLEIYKAIRANTDSLDQFLLAEFDPNALQVGYLPSHIWEWLKKNGVQVTIDDVDDHLKLLTKSPNSS